MEYVVDLQGFKRSTNTFVYKELAIIALDDTALPLVYLFKSPTAWTDLLTEEKCCIRWVELHYHGIPWSSGQIPHKKISKVLENNLRDSGRIYVKGLEKKKWLEAVLPNKSIYNLEDMGCPALKSLYRSEYMVFCANHKLCRSDPVCAFKNVISLKSWLLENRAQDDDDGIDCPCLQPPPLRRPYATYCKSENFLTMYN